MKKKPVRFLPAVGICILAVTLALAACQPTPDQAYVVSKMSDEQLSVTMDPADDAAVSDFPEHWTESVSEEHLTIDIDAQIFGRSGEALPVIQFHPRVYTQAEIDSFVRYFANGKKLYAYPAKLSKTDYQKLIAEAQRGEEIDGQYVVTQESLKRVSDLEALLAKAPDDEVKTYIDSRLTQDINAQTGNKVPESGDNFLNAAIENGNADDAVLVVRNFVDGYNNATLMAYQRGPNILTETLMKSDHFEFSSESIKNQYTKMINDFDMAESEAKTVAEKTLSDLSIADFSEVKAQKGILTSFNNSNGVCSSRSAAAGWCLTYVRQISGMAAAYDVDAYMNSQTDTSTYSSPITVESVTIFVSKDGVDYFRYIGALEKSADVSDHVNILAFDEMKDHIKRQLKYTCIYSQDGNTDVRVEIGQMQLVYAYIRVKDSRNELYAIPAWHISGTMGAVQNGEIVNGTGVDLLLSAIDGGNIEFGVNLY